MHWGSLGSHSQRHNLDLPGPYNVCRSVFLLCNRMKINLNGGGTYLAHCFRDFHLWFICIGCFGAYDKAEHHGGAHGIGHFSHHGDRGSKTREEKMDDPGDLLLFHQTLPPPKASTISPQQHPNCEEAFSTTAWGDIQDPSYCRMSVWGTLHPVGSVLALLHTLWDLLLTWEGKPPPCAGLGWVCLLDVN